MRIKNQPDIINAGTRTNAQFLAVNMKHFLEREYSLIKKMKIKRIKGGISRIAVIFERIDSPRNIPIERKKPAFGSVLELMSLNVCNMTIAERQPANGSVPMNCEFIILMGRRPPIIVPIDCKSSRSEYTVFNVR